MSEQGVRNFGMMGFPMQRLDVPFLTHLHVVCREVVIWRTTRKSIDTEVQEVCADGAKKQELRELSKDSDATFIKKGNSCNLRYKGTWQ